MYSMDSVLSPWMACPMPSKHSQRQSKSKSLKKLSNSARKHGQKSITLASKGNLTRSMIQISILVLSAIGFLGNISLHIKLMLINSFFLGCRRIPLWNGSSIWQNVDMLSTSSRSEGKRKISVGQSQVQLGLIRSLNGTQRLYSKSHLDWILNVLKHLIDPQLHATLIFLNLSLTNTIFPLRTYTTWTRRVFNVEVVGRLKHRSILCPIASVQSTSFVVATLNLLPL